MAAGTPESITTTGLDVDTLLALSRLADPIGVLSIYLDAQPGDGLRASSIDVKNRLSELERRLSDNDSAQRARAVHDGIGRLTGAIERLTDPEERGRGRVLFAAISDPWVTHVSTQLPLPNRVVLDRSAFIHPLLELLDEGRPVGVVLASRTEARLLEWHLGELSPLQELTAAAIEPPHERAGPIGSRPTSRHGTPTGEQRKARERDQAARFIARVADTATQLASDRAWERALVSAGGQLTDSLVAALAPGVRELAVRDLRMLVNLDISILADMVTERVHAAHKEYERRLIRQVREDAQGAGTAALDLSEVVGALNQARVAHLIYDPSIRYRGSVGSDGILYAEGETAMTHDSVADVRLTERIVERALETGARVTPVEGAASNDLAAAGGIAAVLRW